MSIVIDEVVSEITPPQTSATEAQTSPAESPGQDCDQRKILGCLRRHEQRQQRLLAD